MTIKYVGINKLQDFQQASIIKISNKYYEKIARSLKKDIDITLQIKLENVAGKRERFHIRIQVDQPSRLLSSHAAEWDLNMSLHKAYEAVLHEIEHKFKTKPLKWRSLIKRQQKEPEEDEL